jgi:hypothetical protein
MTEFVKLTLFMVDDITDSLGKVSRPFCRLQMRLKIAIESAQHQRMPVVAVQTMHRSTIAYEQDPTLPHLGESTAHPDVER